MKRSTHRPAAWAVLALAVTALTAGCSHQSATSSDALAQQKAGVMGSPAPPAVQAQIQAQLAQQRANQQAAQLAAQQAAAQQAGKPK